MTFYKSNYDYFYKKMQNKTVDKITNKDIAITGIICTILGVILFYWGISAAKENNSGGFRIASGGIIFAFGLCAFSDIGRERKPEPLKDSKDYCKELLNELNQHLQAEEKIEKYITFIEVKASSFVNDQYFGLAAATNKRIIVYESKLAGHKIKSLNYSKVYAVEYEQGLLFDSLEFSTSGEKLSIDKINKGSTAEFVSFVNSKI